MTGRSGTGSRRKLTGPMRLDKAIADARIKRGLKATLHAIGRNLDFTTWTCFPSVATIANSAGYSSRCMRDQLGELRALNVLILEYQSRGGRKPNGRGITHTFRLDIDRLESLANPEATSAFTGNRATPNLEVRDAEHGSHFRQTNHPSHHVNRPSIVSPEPGGDSAGAGWMDEQDPTDLRAELVRHRIAGPNLDALVTSRRLTVAQVRAEAASVNADSRVRNKAAVLVKRLQAIAGIESPRPRSLARELDPFVGRIEQLRRNRSRES